MGLIDREVAVPTIDMLDTGMIYRNAKPHLVSRGTVFLGEADGERASACVPGICVLPNGRWLASFRAARKKAATFPLHTLLTWSDDAGETWSEPIEPFAAPCVERKPGVFRFVQCTPLGGSRVLGVISWTDASDPSLPYINEETEGILDTRTFTVVSEDNGETWSVPERIDTTPFHVPMPTTGPMLLLPNGDWALHFETNKHYYDTSPWRCSSVFMYSRDQGKTWPEYVKAAEDPDARFFYWDQRPGVLPDGRILDLFWTFDRREAVYLNIHAAESKDNGRTWSVPWDIGLPGQPAEPVGLPDGRIVLAYMDREETPVLKARTSSDGGRNWPEDTEIILDNTVHRKQQARKSSMQDALSELGAFSIGLPCTARVADNDALVVYYAGPETDHTGIYWVRVRP